MFCLEKFMFWGRKTGRFTAALASLASSRSPDPELDSWRRSWRRRKKMTFLKFNAGCQYDIVVDRLVHR
jgi:hypothetical protein